MKVYEALGRAFRDEGVDEVFGLMGNANMYWWYDMHANGVAVHATRHEGTALSMAEGWARTTGRPGVCTVTQGPGVTQLGTALTVASRGRIPLVVFGGDGVRSGKNGRNGTQYLDQRRFVEACETSFIPLTDPRDTNQTVREAFFVARSQSRPVFLNVPRDMQDEPYDPAWGTYSPSTLLRPEPQRILPDPERLEDAISMLSLSERTVIVVGRGVLDSPGAEDAVKRLAERTGALLAVTLPMKGWGSDSPFYAGVAGGYATHAGVRLFDQADLVVGVGASLNRHTIQDGRMFGSARFIQIDLRPSLLMGNYSAADVYLQGDATLTVEALDRRLEQQAIARVGYRTPEVERLLKQADPDPEEFELEPGTVDPRAAVRIVDEVLPADVGAVMGNGHTSGIASMSMTKRREVWYMTAFGCIGQTLPTAIGGVTARRPAAMAVIDGDASVLMHINELETAARLGLKLLVVVLNDQAWGAEYQKLAPKGMNPSVAMVETPDLGQVARAFGCAGSLITSLDDIEPAIAEFLRSDGPMLLDIRVSKTVASVHYRRNRSG